MLVSEFVSVIGLSFGALLGLGALFAPDWAAGVVRLKADPDKPGGYSEFRATYGGLLLMVHLVTLLLVLRTPAAGSALVVLPLAAGWLGAAMGRVLSLVLDRSHVAGARIIPVWIGTEVALGLAIAAPVLQFLI